MTGEQPTSYEGESLDDRFCGIRILAKGYSDCDVRCDRSSQRQPASVFAGRKPANRLLSLSPFRTRNIERSFSLRKIMEIRRRLRGTGLVTTVICSSISSRRTLTSLVTISVLLEIDRLDEQKDR